MNFRSIKDTIEKPEQSRLCNKVLNRIDTEGVTPCPRWQFWCRYSGVWVLWLLSVLMGAVSVAVLWYVTEHMRYSLYEATHPNFLSFAIEATPYLWIAALLLMVGSAYYNLRHTKRGYRYTLTQVVLSSILASLLLGWVLHGLNFGHYVDVAFGRSMSTYPSMERLEMKLWQMPEEGRLVASYDAMSEDNMYYVVVDAHDALWRVDVTELRDRDRELLASGASVRLLGTTTSATQNVFHACGVFPWMFQNEESPDRLKTERSEFIARMYDHMEADDRLKALEEKTYEATVYGQSFMDGRCADIAAVRRIDFLK